MFLNKCLLIICFSFVYSMQGLFVDDNANHMAFSGQYETETDSEGKQTTLTGTAAYIINGNLELSASFGKSSFKYDLDSSLDFDLNMFGGAGYYYIKNIAPVNFALGAGFNTVSADADFLDALGAKMTGSLMSYGGGAYKQVVKGVGYEITPFAFFAMNSMNITLSASGMPDLETTDDYNQITFGLGVELGKFTITPTISVVDGENNFNLSVGFIL